MSLIGADFAAVGIKAVTSFADSVYQFIHISPAAFAFDPNTYDFRTVPENLADEPAQFYIFFFLFHLWHPLP